MNLSIYKQTDKVLDVNGYLKFRATGRMVFEWSGACSYSFNLKKGLEPSPFQGDPVGHVQNAQSGPFDRRYRNTHPPKPEQLRLPQDTQVYGGCDDPQSGHRLWISS